ncbi:MAG: glycine--tRNA ligase [Candidatus Komeilibacteria bacterium RIFOXYC1_FULL_37_11]|uniref:Glycine--tRNA ligase n=1 Tax=Candidatus Komeilibacteria bacterium RIFOXYC1_FULL_37_11 TaxID=1798555 RepID=A0A1G2BW71_9BACT|nr:MAG: glycine--tRNA ligase [Candidatus Komeilibacteria bacterium RIFOXYC1_FULL_37_11]OGY95270.1 MAG: glycine--tRNA ligase [Candidatus Komeilibacteria bacterium RIFOXYD1_FULL_37_29]
MKELRKFDKVVNLAKTRGFIFPSSDIYGGLNSIYDYGPLGTELKNNLKKAWFDFMLARRDVVGLDSAILMHPQIWKASGHLDGFSDPLVDCKKCKSRFRADHLLEKKGIKPTFGKDNTPNMSDVKCPECGGELTEVRQFNLMFKTFMGPLEDSANQIYLRPETAQGIYVNFLNVLNSLRLKIPFGIAQIGKAFRNEITPGNFIFRMREFEQMEMQYFVHPDKTKDAFEKWQNLRMDWYKSLGIDPKNLRFREHAKDELAHYAKKALDIEYNFAFSENETFKELEGIHHRGDWDLSQHQKYSQQKLTVKDENNKEYIPNVIETSGGVDRATLAFLMEAYTEIDGGRTTTTESSKEKEVVLKLDKRLAPIKIAIFPLSKKTDLMAKAIEIYDSLATKYRLTYDETGSIGKRYRRQDEIGTPYCVTVDFDTLGNNLVTVRDRDTMKQDHINISELAAYFQEKFK